VASGAASGAAPGCFIALQQSCFALQQSRFSLQQSGCALQHSCSALQHSCFALQHSCALANAAADSAMAATSGMMVLMIVFLYIVFLLIDFRFKIELSISARAAAFPLSHAAAMRHRDGAKNEGWQREHLRYGSKSMLKTEITCVRRSDVHCSATWIAVHSTTTSGARP
jgi:hypothetical protein